jgi:hypothetical protein
LPSSARSVRPEAVAGDDVAKLRHYCEDNFAASAVFVDSPGERTDCVAAGDAQIVWLAMRDRTRATTSHRRSARAVLAKLRIPTTGLRGTWLALATDEAVRAATSEHRARRPSRPRCQAQRALESHAPRTASDKVALLSTRAPRDTAGSQDAASRCTEGAPGDADVKVIELGQAGGSYRGGAAKSFSFEVLR